MEDFDATLTHSRLESMIEHFIETQTIQNEEIRNQSLQNNENLRQLNNVVESLVTHNQALETQISLLEQKPLGPFPEEHVDVVITSSENKSKILRRVIIRLKSVIMRLRRVLVRKELRFRKIH